MLVTSRPSCFRITIAPLQYFLLRFYRRPPRMSSLIVDIVQRLLPLAIIAHLFVSALVYARTDVIPSVAASLGDPTTSQSYHNLLEKAQDRLVGTAGAADAISRLHAMSVLIMVAGLVGFTLVFAFYVTAGRALKVIVAQAVTLLSCRCGARMSLRQRIAMRQVIGGQEMHT